MLGQSLGINAFVGAAKSMNGKMDGLMNEFGHGFGAELIHM